MNIRNFAIIIMLIIIVGSLAGATSPINENKKSFLKLQSTELFWEQLNEDGFGNKFNVALRGIEVFQDFLVVGTCNLNSTNRRWDVKSFFKIAFGGAFNYGSIVTSNGCEIWCYNESNGWRQLIGDNEEAIHPAGFGNKNNWECSAMIKFKDYLYACIFNGNEGGQVWRTDDIFGEWEKVVESGFGNKNNQASFMAEVFNDYLYIGTMNFDDGCEVYRSSSGNKSEWECVVGKDAEIRGGFWTSENFYVWSMSVYNSCLYVGTDNTDQTNGGELWKSEDGVNWKPVIAYRTFLRAKLNGADFPGGMGRITLGGIRRLAVYNNELYVGFVGADWYGSITIDGIGKVLTVFERPFDALIHPISHFNSVGLEIWKYNASGNYWKRAVGASGRGNCSAGFGDPKNDYPWSMEVFNNQLYVGTFNLPKPVNVIFYRNGFLSWDASFDKLSGKAELWGYNGKIWQQKVGDESNQLDQNNPPNGFGDDYNVGIRAMKVYNNSLIVGVSNENTGCEIWRCNLN